MRITDVDPRVFLPSSWPLVPGGGGSFIPDCNGDRTAAGGSTSDFAIMFVSGSSAARLVVFW